MKRIKMQRLEIANGLDKLREEFLKYDSIECREEDADLIGSAVDELSNEDAKKISTLQFLLTERDKEIELLKKENQELSEELEIQKWAFKGLKSSYTDIVKTKSEGESVNRIERE